MIKEKLPVLMRTIVDGEMKHEYLDHRMVYTLADGRKQINDWRGGRSEVKEENGRLVKEWVIRSIRKIDPKDVFATLASRTE